MAIEQTMPTYTYADTSDENVKRFIDVEGNWQYYWLVKEQKFVKAVTHVLGLGYSKGPRFYNYLLSITKDEQQKVLTEAGNRGARVHAAITDLLRGVKVTMLSKYPSETSNQQEVLTVREWKCLLAFQRFHQDYNWRTVAFEQTVYSDKHNYAGTFDALGVITVPAEDKNFPKDVRGKDVLILVDWKTSSGIWDEYKAQVAAYRQAFREHKHHDAFYKAFKGRAFSGVVRVGSKHKCGYELAVWSDKECEDHFKRLFLGAQAIADETEPTFEPVVEQLPTEIIIKAAKAELPVKKARAKKAETN